MKKKDGKKWGKLTGSMKKSAAYWICGGILVGACGVFTLRLIDWQIINGQEYLNRANQTSVATVSLEAARGEILDVDGEPLAANETIYKIVLERAYVDRDNLNDMILTLVQLLDSRGEAWRDELPIVIDENGEYAFAEGREDDVEDLKSKEFLNMNSYASADLCMRRLISEDWYNCDETKYTKEQIRDIVSVRYSMTKENFSISTPYTFAEGISKETVAIVEENSQSLPGVAIKISTTRTYTDGTLAPHIIGSIGVISQEEYDQLKDEGYAYNSRLGKNGVEGAFESYLRGQDGTQVIELTKTGAVASSTIKEQPVPGNTVFTTLDSNLQRVANESLARNIQAAREAGEQRVEATGETQQGEDCVAGAAVVLSVKDFSVLAASTYPTYDLDLYSSDSSYYTSLLQDSTNPLFNRAFNGAFMPGSAFKPAVALAALEEGTINASTHITCNHVYTALGPTYQPRCLGTHGSIEVITALQKSCNIFFYETGRQLGIQNIDSYAQALGLGVKTGIELTETEGTLASPENRTAAGGVWNPGDVVQAAIGQSDNSFSPLQLATYCATIANNGTRLQTHLIRKITDYNQETVIMENDPENPTVVEQLEVSPENLQIVKEGMLAVCEPGGTAASVFSNYGITIAAKTGTAENPPHSDNLTFIAYGPYEDPEIAVAVVLEYGGSGTYAMNVAKDIFDAYFAEELGGENAASDAQPA